MSKHILRRVESEGWRVIRLGVVPELDKSGNPHPRAGEIEETTISYPGRELTVAAKRLLDEAIPDGAEVADIGEWRAVYDAAASRVVAAVKEWIDGGGR